MMCWALLHWAWSELSTGEVSASSKGFLYLISLSAGVSYHAGAKDRICDGFDVPKTIVLVEFESVDRSVVIFVL